VLIVRPDVAAALEVEVVEVADVAAAAGVAELELVLELLELPHAASTNAQLANVTAPTARKLAVLRLAIIELPGPKFLHAANAAAHL
jgi:hypothetical protein